MASSLVLLLDCRLLRAWTNTSSLRYRTTSRPVAYVIFTFLIAVAASGQRDRCYVRHIMLHSFTTTTSPWFFFTLSQCGPVTTTMMTWLSIPAFTDDRVLSPLHAGPYHLQKLQQYHWRTSPEIAEPMNPEFLCAGFLALQCTRRLLSLSWRG